jgi:hypothetical protein
MMDQPGRREDATTQTTEESIFTAARSRECLQLPGGIVSCGGMLARRGLDSVTHRDASHPNHRESYTGPPLHAPSGYIFGQHTA